VAELARIELAFGSSFDAADGESVTLEQLQVLAPESWMTLRLEFHDSVQLLSQTYNSFQIWQALSSDETPPAKAADDTTWLIWRQELVSRYRSLQPAETAALEVMLSNGDFSTMCETLIAYAGEQETPALALSLLQQWIHDRMIVGLAV
jgi:hypothetical protein